MFQEGREEGLEIGALKKQLIVIANVLTMTDLDITQIAALAEVDESFVTEIKEKIETET